MTHVLYGKPVVMEMNTQMLKKVEVLKQQNVIPTLATLRVGNRGDDIAYEKGIVKRCEAVGIAVKKIILPESVPQDQVIERIKAINEDHAVHGCLIFRPMPETLDDEAICDALAPEKDVDGITQGSLAGVFTGKDRGYAPCTAVACMKILDYYGVELEGKRAVVIGRSLVIGKPVAMMLLARHATVTMCHTRTKAMAAIARQADILIAAAGHAGTVDQHFCHPGQVVIDVGINFSKEGKMIGDANFEEISDVHAAITPVPGGVGTVTTSVLAEHVIQAAEKTLNQ